MAYFDFENGKYIHDFIDALQGNLASEFHIEYSEGNSQKMTPVIDRQYEKWNDGTKRRW